MTVPATNPVNSSQPSSNNAATTATAQSATVDYNSFLTLLVAELKNQDPTQPTDPTQYMSQLASFSSVGQAIQTNTKLDSLLTGSALTQAEIAIGRTATSADGKTTGQIVSVNIASDNTIKATLADGSLLTLGSGVTIS